MRVTPIILAGGAGERLWPLSQQAMPKQFVVHDGSGASLFQATVGRVTDRSRFTAPLVLCNHAHRFLVRAQLHAIGCEDAQIIIEPAVRNTAPAIALAAMQVASHAPDGLMLILPSDHRIDNQQVFFAAVGTAHTAAQQGRIITFGITPSAPETGYGYIHYGALLDANIRKVDRFVEKPDRALAETFIVAGDYGWNSGMFCASAETLLMEYRQHAPAIYEACLTAYHQRVDDHGFICPEPGAFSKVPSISFDYAIMEQTEHAAVLPVEMGWSDLGSWAALDAIADKDGAQNAVIGAAYLRDVENCYIHADSMSLAVVGLRDMVVVESNGHVLVTPKDRSLEAKAFAQTVTPTYVRQLVHRPWGHYVSVDRDADYQVKKLYIKPGEKISLQTHRARSEHWVVVAGVATVTRGEEVFTLQANESAFIAAGERHRLENNGTEALIVVEVQTGHYLGEDDIQRFEDAYARIEA